MEETQKRRRAETSPRIVASLDLDCFYASVAIRARPHLKDEPVGILQKNLVVTTNYVARGLGLKKMTFVSEAQKHCPQLHLIDGSDLTPFRAASMEVLSVIRKWISNRLAQHNAGKDILIPCEKLGLDEVFIDLTHLVELEKKNGKHDWKFSGHIEGSSSDDFLVRSLMVGSQLVHEIRMEVSEKTKLNMCGGISSNKLLAKLASNMHKPNDQTAFLKDSAVSYIGSLCPRSLMGIGHAMWGKLKAWSEKANVSIATVTLFRGYFEYGDRVKELADILGGDAHARHILRLCRGEDDSVVKNSGPPKSYSCEDSFLSCTTMEDLTKRMEYVAGKLLRRLAADFLEWGFREPKSFSVKARIKGQGYRFFSRSAPLQNVITQSVCRGEESAVNKAQSSLVTSALKLLKSNGDVSPNSPFNFSLLGIGVGGFLNVQKDADISRFLLPSKQPVENNSVDAELPRGTAADTAMENISPEEKPSCPICQCALPLGAFFQNAHIDSCVASSSLSNPSTRSETQADVVQKPSLKLLNSQKNLEGVREEAGAASERPSCPICQCSLPLGAFFQNSHIDSCISNDHQPTKLRPSPRARKKVKRSSRPIESFFKKK